jgi:hypothetical protein
MSALSKCYGIIRSLIDNVVFEYYFLCCVGKIKMIVMKLGNAKISPGIFALIVRPYY